MNANEVFEPGRGHEACLHIEPKAEDAECVTQSPSLL